MRHQATWLIVGVAGFVAAPAWAAFELRDASPAALGTASLDVDAEFLPGEHDLGPRGWCFGGSHASLYQVAGLAADAAWAGIEGRVLAGALAWSQAGLPGDRETRLRFALRESAPKRIAVGAAAEWLGMSLEGEAPVGGWAFGCSARSASSIRGVVLEVAVGADRLLRSRSLDRLGVRPSVPISVQLRSGDATIAWIDRWDSDGSRSPRVAVGLDLGTVGSIRLARGERPERIGVAVSLRSSRFEVSAGRLDLASGGTVSALSIEWMASRGQRRA